MSRIDGKVVLITGASSGIGEAVAKHLSSLGARLVLGARRTEKLQSLAQSLKTETVWRATDVTNLSSVQALAAAGIEKFGRIDALVNNAGIMPVSPLAMGRIDEWDRTIDVNIKGVLYGIHAVLNHMLERGSGSIINVASVSAYEAHAGGAVYAASKFAVRAIGDALRKETSGKVRVCTISPGPTESELSESIAVPEIKAMADKIFTVAMPAQAIAEAVGYVLTQPDSVAVNEMVIRPLAAQAF
jgi:NADP-dependent 3-hydroxy acid dehydrogenase YdfG